MSKRHRKGTHRPTKSPAQSRAGAKAAAKSAAKSPARAAEIAGRLGLAVVHHQAGRYREAEAEYRAVLAGDPRNPDALHLLGVLALQLGQAAPAAELIAMAVAAADHVADYHDNLGTALAALDRPVEAVEAHRRAATLAPQTAKPLFNLGNAFQAQAMTGQAAAAFAAAVTRQPDYAKAWYNLGNALRAQDRTAEAVRALEHAVALAPDMIEAHNNLADALTSASRLDEALAQNRLVLQLRPNDATAHYNLGAVLQRKDAYEGAEIAYREALKRDPEHLMALNNLGAVLHKLGRPDQAEQCCRMALRLRPAFAEALYNLGNALQAQGRFDEAEACYEETLARNPGLAAASHNLALMALQQGQVARGWQGYERRFAAGMARPDRRIDAPRWQGELLGGRRLLVWREQGVGDEILFASCYRDVIDWAGGPVTIETDRRLVGLFARSFPGATVRAESVARDGAETVVPPDCDVQVPAGSLPLLLRSTLAEFTEHRPWLVPDPALATRWRDRIAALGPGLKIGIGWRSQLMTRDRKGAYTKLDQWGPLFALPGVIFVNLQYDDCAGEIAAAEARFGVRIHRWDDLDLKDDFEAAAALTVNLDLVITPAMSAGELAGGLGVPVWRFGHRDWTLLGAGARPWYPSHRTFQPRPGEEFDAVLVRMARTLTALRDTAPEEAAPKEAAPKEAAPKEAASVEAVAPPRVPPPAPQPPFPHTVEEELTRAIGLHRAGRLAEAMGAYGRVLDLDPDHADARHLLGVAAHQAGRHEEALSHIGAALRQEPDFATAWNHLGLVREALGDREQARACFARAVALRPSFPEALTHLGLSLHQPARVAEAKRWHGRAIRLSPANLAAHTNMGHAFEVEGRFADAIDRYRRALALLPDSADTLNNLGSMAKSAGDNTLSRRFVTRALAVDPGLSLAGWNLGLLDLEEGNIAAGWSGYGRRFSARQLQRARRIRLPLWNGEPLNGRRLLVWSEQGLGDEILFGSCLDALENSGGTVILECDRRLVPLFARTHPWLTVRAEGVDAQGREVRDPPDADLQIPAGSLAALARGRLDRFPARPAYLAPDPERAALWRARVAALGPGLKVGISWRSQFVTAHRESAYTRIEDWLPLIDLPGVHTVTLQYGDCAAELASIERDGRRRLHRWDDLDLRDDLEGVAALVAALDLVVVPATAVGELAGALGVPVWRVGRRDWTQLGSGVRPWFPSMRLVQPKASETLGDVVARIARALRQQQYSAQMITLETNGVF